MYYYDQNPLKESSGSESAGQMFHATTKEAWRRFGDFGAPKPLVELDRNSMDVVLEERVRSIVLFLGFSPKNKGFHIAVTGCIEAYKKPLILDKMSQDFYPLVAKLCGTTPQRAERCVRHELLRCYNEGTLKNMNILFKMRLRDDSQRMSNGDFFSFVTQKLCIELGDYRPIETIIE